MSSEWEGLKRLGRMGAVEELARQKLSAVVAGARLRKISSDSDLEKAASDLRLGVDAILGWPEGLRRIESAAQMSGERMLEAKELRLDGCGIGANGAGAIAVLLRESKSLESIDLSNNGFGDAGVAVIAEAIRSSTRLRTLRLNGNGLRSGASETLCALLKSNRTVRLELRSNSFDSTSESNLRAAGGARVVISDRDTPFDQPAPPTTSAEGFLAFTDRQSPSKTTTDADAFLAFGASRGGSSAPLPSGPTDADAFLAFAGGSGGVAPNPRSPTKSMDSTSAKDFLSFTGASSDPVTKKGVSFGTNSSKLGAGASDASAFLASLGD